MNRLFKTAILSSAVAAATLVPVLEASAGERWRQQRPRHPVVKSHDDRRDELLAAGIVGLAVGALVVGSIAAANSQPEYRVYPDAGHGHGGYRPDYGNGGYRNGGYRGDGYATGYFPPAPDQFRRRPAPRVVYVDENAGIEPWTREWHRWCGKRYRSFNHQTGTYRGYDGYDHFCVVK